MTDTGRLIVGDVRQVLEDLEPKSISCAVTSPPYWGLRDYGAEGQIGLEATPAEYVEVLVQVFRQVRRALRPDGTLWLNLGDSYAGDGGGADGAHSGLHRYRPTGRTRSKGGDGLKRKDLVGIPWRVALALQADGWWLRSEIIWHKPACMPESVADRPTRSHEHLFLLAKSDTYYYDAAAVREPDAGLAAGNGFAGRQGGARDTVAAGGEGSVEPWSPGGGRNRRTVWTVPPAPFKGAHFATFPPALVEPCILAGCPEGGTVLDPFFGAGTVGLVCDRLNRAWVGIEINPEYAEIARRRLSEKQEHLFPTPSGGPS